MNIIIEDSNGQKYLMTGEELIEGLGEYMESIGYSPQGKHDSKEALRDFLSTFEGGPTEMVSLCCSAGLTNEGRCTDCKELSELVPTE